MKNLIKTTVAATMMMSTAAMATSVPAEVDLSDNTYEKGLEQFSDESKEAIYVTNNIIDSVGDTVGYIPEFSDTGELTLKAQTIAYETLKPVLKIASATASTRLRTDMFGGNTTASNITITPTTVNPGQDKVSYTTYGSNLTTGFISNSLNDLLVDVNNVNQQGAELVTSTNFSADWSGFTTAAGNLTTSKTNFNALFSSAQALVTAVNNINMATGGEPPVGQ